MSSVSLQPGDMAPNISLPRDGGATVTLADLRGQPVVIFFYAEDGTPSCTNEVQSFSALATEFAALDTALFGLSRDPVAKHDRFIAKHGLQVALLSDVAGTAADAFGFWVEKQMYGRTYMGMERSTVLIGADGRIVQIWRSIRVKGHADVVLAAAQALAAKA